MPPWRGGKCVLRADMHLRRYLPLMGDRCIRRHYFRQWCEAHIPAQIGAAIHAPQFPALSLRCSNFGTNWRQIGLYQVIWWANDCLALRLPKSLLRLNAVRHSTCRTPGPGQGPRVFICILAINYSLLNKRAQWRAGSHVLKIIVKLKF